MRFALNEEQEMFRDAIRGTLERDVPINRIRGWAEGGGLSVFDQFSARQGWQGLGVSEEAGGQGGGMVELAILFEELGRAAAPSGRLLATSLGLALAKNAPSALKFFARIITGDDVVAVAVSGGMPLDDAPHGLTMRNGRLEGSIPLVLDAPAADWLVVPVHDAVGAELCLVSTKGAGVTVTTRLLVDHTRRFGDVRFEGAEARSLARILPEQLAHAAAGAALLVAAESLGLARRMLEMTTAYVKERVQFGVPVGSFQAVKHSAAEALVEIEAAHSGIYYGAWALESRAADALVQAWIAKACATEAAGRIADRALFLHGAIGYTWEYDLHYYYKRAKANVELFGPPKVYRERVADTLNLIPG